MLGKNENEDLRGKGGGKQENIASKTGQNALKYRFILSRGEFEMHNIYIPLNYPKMIAEQSSNWTPFSGRFHQLINVFVLQRWAFTNKLFF